jgi:Calcineurin-like phosphoesterase
MPRLGHLQKLRKTELYLRITDEAMIAFSDSPVVAEQQMAAIIYYLTTFGFVDGRFDDSERTEIRRWIRALVEMRVDAMGLDTLTERLETVEKQNQYFERVFQRVTAESQALFDEAVAHGEKPEDFVMARLRLRCYELFKAFDPRSQETLLYIVNRVLEADGVIHAIERRFRDDLIELLKLEPARTAGATPVSAAQLPPITFEAPQRLVGTLTEHALLQLGEEHYSRDPGRLSEQLLRDYELMREAVDAWELQRGGGAGRLTGKQQASELTGAPFLDGFVYVLPDDGKERELIVVGDLHGCYSCLKAALLQSDFFPKVMAHRKDPAANPEVKLIFLGDYIDRGRFSYDGVLRTVLQLFVSMPEHVVVLRGNHEYYVDLGDRISGGVAPAEAIASFAPYFPKRMFEAFKYCFERMPSMLIAGPLLFVHAGIPRDDTQAQKWRDLSTLNDAEMRFQMMWSDPSPANHIPAELQRQNARFSFGKQQFRAFMERIGCHTLLRGHEKINEGYKRVFSEDGYNLLNLFSAGGKENADLPENASYRSVTPMALTIRQRAGQTSVVPWPIEWQRWNDPVVNGFMRKPAEIAFRVV